MRLQSSGLLLATACCAAAAQPAPPALPLWELGIFGVVGSQQAYPGSNQQVRPTLALPFFIYRGPLLRADEGSVGLRAFKSPAVEVDIGAAISFGSSAGATDTRRGMPDIGTLVEAGPRLKVDLGDAPLGGRWQLTLPLRGVFDVNDGFAWKGLSLQPGLGWKWVSMALGRSAGITASALMGNARMTDTFYGVAPAYATATRPAFDARGGLIAWRLAASGGMHLTRDWSLFAYGRIDSVDGAANRASPLVDRRVGASVGVGLSWTGLYSDSTAND